MLLDTDVVGGGGGMILLFPVRPRGLKPMPFTEPGETAWCLGTEWN